MSKHPGRTFKIFTYHVPSPAWIARRVGLDAKSVTPYYNRGLHFLSIHQEHENDDDDDDDNDDMRTMMMMVMM
eukprot:10502139-Karenia_brevis.AAC.1